MALTQLDSSQTNAFANTFLGVGRNRIINGAMMLDQANALTDVTVNGAGPFYTADMFTAYGVAASGVYTMAVDQGTVPVGFLQSLRATCSTADASIGATDLYVLQHAIEAPLTMDWMFSTSSAKTLTLSFWVRSTLTGTYTGSISNAGFGGNRYMTFEYTINSASTWERKTITITPDTGGSWDTRPGFTGSIITWALAIGSNFQTAAGTWGTTQVFGTSNQVNFMSSNSSRTWAMTGVQLEIGTTATNFEYKPYMMDLAQCQRYYEKSYEVGVKPGTSTGTGAGRYAGMNTQGTTYVYQSAFYKVTKRTVPTVTYYTPTGTSGSITVTSTSNVDSNQAAIAITNSSMEHSTAQNTAGVAAQLAKFHWVSDARL